MKKRFQNPVSTEIQRYNGPKTKIENINPKEKHKKKKKKNYEYFFFNQIRTFYFDEFVILCVVCELFFSA